MVDMHTFSLGVAYCQALNGRTDVIGELKSMVRVGAITDEGVSHNRRIIRVNASNGQCLVVD